MKSRVRRKPPLRSYPTFESCGSCTNGWLTDASGAAFRCSCWRAFTSRAATINELERQRQSASDQI